MFIVHVVPLLGGTDTTMSPSRHSTLCWIVSLIHGGGPGGGPSWPASCAALTRSPRTSAAVGRALGAGTTRMGPRVPDTNGNQRAGSRDPTGISLDRPSGATDGTPGLGGTNVARRWTTYQAHLARLGPSRSQASIVRGGGQRRWMRRLVEDRFGSTREPYSCP